MVDPRRGEPWLRYLLAVGMLAIGVLHFANPAPFVRIIPHYFPASLALPLVLVSGVLEIAGGVGLLVPRTRRLAAIGLMALYVAVFPANIEHALHPELLGTSAAVAYARLPFQLLFIAWAWRYTRRAG